MNATTFERAAGASLITSAALTAMTAGLTLANSGDTDGPLAVLDGTAVITFIVGFFGLRQRVTRARARPLLMVAGFAIAAGFVGTLIKISGVALAIPVLAAAAFVIVRSRWRVGEAAILLLIVGVGIGVASIVAGQIDPNTGSQTDQAAIMGIALGSLLAAVAAAGLSALPVMIRVAVVSAPALTIASAAGLGAALGGAAPIVLGLPIIVCWTAAWGYVGGRFLSGNRAARVDG